MSDFFNDQLDELDASIDPAEESYLINKIQPLPVFNHLLNDDLKQIVKFSERIQLKEEQVFLN